jgi:hypothetical protein
MSPFALTPRIFPRRDDRLFGPTMYRALVRRDGRSVWYTMQRINPRFVSKLFRCTPPGCPHVQAHTQETVGFILCDEPGAMPHLTWHDEQVDT